MFTSSVVKKANNHENEIIVQLTTVHPRFDTRILVKEAQTLAYNLPHKILMMVADGKGNVNEKKGFVSIHDIGCLDGGRLGRMLRGPWRAFFAICKIKPAIVHFHDPELLPLALLLKVIGYKIIYDVHEDVPLQTLSKEYLPWAIRKPAAWVIRCAEWLGAKTFDAVIPATPKIAERFPVRKTFTIQNFPLVDELATSISIPNVQRSASFAYVGDIALIRGVVEMIRALELLDDIPGASLELAGTFSPPQLENTVRELRGWASVHYHGQVDRHQVAQILNKVRGGLVVLHPEPTHVESYAIKMFEYMAVGIPVIASDFPLWKCIIDDAQCGLVVDPRNPKAIAEAMRWILDHPAEAEAMGRHGRQAVERIYNWETEAVKLLSLYKMLLDS
jgi:glycosyltransferase involved in cell wall biosynthesis